MNGRTRCGERGFTLIEMIVAVAIVATTVAAGIGLSLSSRSLAVATAATEFDRLLDATRTIARETSGATIVFAPDGFGDGTQVRVLTSGPNGTLVATTMPVVQTRAAIAETSALGPAPFAFVLHATGLLAGRPGFRLGDATTTPETACPPSGAFHFTITAAGGSADRYVPCRIDLASTGSVAYTVWPAATLAPLPTPCATCTTATLPPMPTSSPTCPPGYTPIAGGCAPVSGPHYHVTASASSASIAVGASDAVTAQATLTNPLSVPAGTPATVPISAQSADATCSVSPAGSQPSGTAFAAIALSAGTCTIAVQADVSAVAGATADSATVVVAVSAAPAATPTPQGCDLVQNGKCYHLIVPETNQQFTKYVVPATQCAADNSTCWYVDQVQEVQLFPPFVVQTAVPPTDSAHELLFQVTKVSGMIDGCAPYSAFASVPGANPIEWPQIGTGAPSSAPIGFGEPSVFISRNQVVSTPTAVSAEYPWLENTYVDELRSAIVEDAVGNIAQFTWSNPSAQSSTQWYPDFPGCDSYDPAPTSQYGLLTVGVVFDVYQSY